MSLITNHWSGTTNEQNADTRRDYHVAYGADDSVDKGLIDHLLTVQHATDVDYVALRKLFTVEKNWNFSTKTRYATWEENSDPRDGSPNIEVCALSMVGHSVSVSGPWGDYPFTIAHFFMAAAISARVALIKNLDTGATFDPDGFQNGPQHVISTHAERAIQTPNPPYGRNPAASTDLGYFIYSGDPNCRWDLAAKDVSDAHLLSQPESARKTAIATAGLLRQFAHEIKAAGVTDMWGLDKAAE